MDAIISLSVGEKSQKSLSVFELRKKLNDLGLDHIGKKQTLIDRLKEYEISHNAKIINNSLSDIKIMRETRMKMELARNKDKKPENTYSESETESPTPPKKRHKSILEDLTSKCDVCLEEFWRESDLKSHKRKKIQICAMKAELTEKEEIRTNLQTPNSNKIAGSGNKSGTEKQREKIKISYDGNPKKYVIKIIKTLPEDVITLGDLKRKLPISGNFRYFIRTFDKEDEIMEEFMDDCEKLPSYNNFMFVECHKMLQ